MSSVSHIRVLILDGLSQPLMLAYQYTFASNIIRDFKPDFFFVWNLYFHIVFSIKIIFSNRLQQLPQQVEQLIFILCMTFYNNKSLLVISFFCCLSFIHSFMQFISTVILASFIKWSVKLFVGPKYLPMIRCIYTGTCVLMFSARQLFTFAQNKYVQRG